MTIYYTLADIKAAELLEELRRHSDNTLSFIISATPTGKARDTLTEANLHIMKAIELIKEAREP